MQNPPDGMIDDDIRRMSEDDLLDMDHFLHEDDEFGEDLPGAEGFFLYLLITHRLLVVPADLRVLFISRVLRRRTFL